MKFKKYNSLENSYRTKFVDRIVETGNSGGQWIVTEKVHGSNFSIWFNGTELRTASRSGFIGEDQNFFNSNQVKDRLTSNMKNLWNALDAKEITIFGELYGGNYPHENVEKDNNSKSVQSGIWYNPNIDFYAFDLVIDGEYYPYEDAVKILQEYGFFVAEILFKGTFEQCLEYTNEFQTTIPKILGLPEIERNICEGVVLKPNITKFFIDGKRVIVKNKNEKWNEKGKSKTPKVKETITLSQESEYLLGELISNVTENRLRNVLSKFGPVTDKDFGKIMGLMVKDVYEDFFKDHKEAYESLDKAESKELQKLLGSETANLIRSNFLNIVDGVF